jgi:sec-independent protein translocase protein TatB
MEFLGVGPTEFIFIIIIALIVLGPKDLAKTGSTVAKWLNGILQSDGWKTIRRTSDELRRLPTQLMREDNFKNYPLPADLEREAQQKRGAWTGQTAVKPDLAANPQHENTIQPPVAPDAQTVKSAPKKSAASKKATSVKKTGKKPAAKPSTRTPRKKNA